MQCFVCIICQILLLFSHSIDEAKMDFYAKTVAQFDLQILQTKHFKSNCAFVFEQYHQKENGLICKTTFTVLDNAIFPFHNIVK